MRGIAPAARALVVAAAALAALAPWPASLVERSYGRLYPLVQAWLTAASNAVPIAVMDVALVVAAGLVLWWWSAALGAAWRRRAWRPAGRAALATLTLTAAVYLWFLAAWGLNYARPPIEVRLGLPAGSPSAEDVTALLDEAVTELNAGYVAAHAARPIPYSAERDLARLLPVVEARHGRGRPSVPGRPKPTILTPYFRMAGVDGLTAPLALETLLNPDLTAMERPFTLAHEWAHLSGHAPEADANFVAFLVTMEPGADPVTRYSGWLFLVSETARQVPAAVRRLSMAALGEGPRGDLADIARRLAQRVDLVERVGWRVYDSYLRSQGVDEGVRSYSRVVELIVRARRMAGAAPAAVPQ